MNELETHLRSVADHLPEPDEQATEAARALMHSSLQRGPGRRERGRPWFGRARTRPFLLAAAALLAVAAGGALAARTWSLGDLPPFGDRAEDAFVLPSTDILPGGYERTRPPRYDELPERPALLFPRDVGYTEALTRYAAARARQRVLPVGVELTDPLPGGKIVMLRDDGRLVLDPAAPYGYAVTTGLVKTLPGSFGGEALPIARCQLLIGADDPASPACDAPGVTRSYVREGVGGRWVPSPAEEELDDPEVNASTQLSVLRDSRLPRTTLPEHVRSMLGDRLPREPVVAVQAQKTSRVTLVVVTSGDHLCFVDDFGGGRSGAVCGPRSSFLSRGAVLSTVRWGSAALNLNGLVGDGVTRARTDTGVAARVINNTFTMLPGDAARTVTFSGPVGTFTLPIRPGADEAERFTPDRTHERLVTRIPLVAGGHASIRVAPNRGGGQCQWLYILGQARSSGCSRPSDPPLPYDVVTAGFSPAGRGYPYVYSGQFAPEVAGVEMEFADRTERRLPVTEGFVLFEIPKRNLEEGRWPVAVTTYDQQGVPLVRNRIADFRLIVRQQGIPK